MRVQFFNSQGKGFHPISVKSLEEAEALALENIPPDNRFILDQTEYIYFDGKYRKVEERRG